MVRFSDMLGGSGEPEEARAAKSPYAALASDAPDAADPDPDADEAEEIEADEIEAEPEPAAEGADQTPDAASTSVGFESPEDVLVRLTQYATSARAADPAPPAPIEELTVEEPTDTVAADEEPEHSDEDPLSTPGDDFLPRPKNVVRRSRKRRP